MQGSYVYGLDSSPGTIISDYVLFGLCLLYGLCIFRLYRSSKWESTRLQKKSEVKVSIHLYALGKDFEKARTFLLVLMATFLLCAIMCAVGAVLHHFVPLVEPTLVQNDHQTSDSVNIDLWQFILSKVFPWVIVWQFANVCGVLYGIGVFLTVLYTIDFHMSTKYYSYHRSLTILSGNNALSRFNYIKKFFIGAAIVTVIFHGISRFHKIFEFRSVVFEKPPTEISAADFNIAKLNLDQFGWIWSATSATFIMFSAFVVNAIISLYMFIKAMSAKVASNVDFGGVKTSLIRTVGAWMLLIGGIIQILWAESCGNNTPHDCPFPLWFNHNAWYHLLQGSGMTGWFLAEWTYFKGNSLVKKNT